MNAPARADRRVSGWAAAHPLRVDLLFAVAMGALAMIGYLSAEPEPSQHTQDLLGAAIIAGQTVAFAFRRRAPLRSLVGVALVTIAFWVSDYPSNFDAFSLLSVYAAVAHGGPDRHRVWRVVGGTVLVMTLIAVLGVLSPDEDLPAAAVIGIATLHLTAAITGEVVHDRRRRLHELEQRAVRAEAERELLAREAVLAERARIARDLHDIVAHAMSVMVVQAGAAERVVEDQPERAARALGHVQATGRAALADMRRMLDVLRSDDAHDPQLAPQPTMDDLGDIVRHCVDAGIPTEVTIEGQRPAEVHLGEEMAGYRIVQEALTNVIKHAGRPARAAVRVTYAPEHMRLEVTDDGRGATITDVETATGQGLIGMRERVDLYHGSLHAGPRPGGGFRVAATIPFNGDDGRAG